jgi:predicted TPR repeat methyltransferase/predicted negative regulator of RcsB-dependent stress response
MTVLGSDDREAVGRARRADTGQRNQPERPRGARTVAQSFHAAISFHQQGRLREAEQLYRAVLEVNESDFDCLHNLGLLHAQAGRFDDAVELLRAGARQDPRSVEVHNNLANVLAILRRHDEAVAGFRVAISLKPDFAEAYNNLGNALAVQGGTDEAIEHYGQALALRPDYSEAHLNLGNILNDQGRLDDAAAHYGRALAVSPQMPEAHYRLGNVLKKQGRAGDAAACYQRTLALKPDHAEAHSNLGTVLFERRDLKAAMGCFERAVALKPDFAEAWLGLGQVFHQAQHYDEALAAFARAPDLAEAWLGRARSLNRLKRSPEAIVAYRQALAKGGDAEVIHYYLAALGAERAPLAAPRRLVSTVFDRYSDRYDQHVLGPLQYRTPGLLFDAAVRSASSCNLDILDLGCGTGLSGARFRPRARTLVGIDISSSMLDVARQRQIYDNLVCGELVEFLQMQTEKFDLAVAADVLVYIGDLSRVFHHVRGALRDKGLFGFSVEASDEQDFVLRPTLRYAHSTAYIRKLSAEHGFVVESLESKVIRQEDGNDVAGHIAMLRRS